MASREQIFAELIQAHRDEKALTTRWAAEMPGCSLSVHLVGLELAAAINAVRRRAERLREKLPPPSGNDDTPGGTPASMKEAA